MTTIRLLLLSAVLVAAAGPAPANAQDGELGVTFDLTYTSKWMSKGFAVYGEQGGLFKTIDLDLYGTGFGVKVTHRNATASGYVDFERFDYRTYYRNRLFEGESYATNYYLSVGYEHYPGLARSSAPTTYEWIFGFSWPNILPDGLAPGYIAHYEYPAGSNYDYNYITGWVHRFLLGYDMTVPDLPEPLHLSGELAYTDGLGRAEHDWSYFTMGLSTKFKINENLTFIPGLYQQISMEDSVSESDVTYVILTMKYKF
ncbi:MAG: hypothetical protein ACYTE5_02575 [Planctomycetota bacterium]|jgi:hypothetical protein